MGFYQERFPEASELGRRQAVHAVTLFRSNAANMVPALIGLLVMIPSIGGALFNYKSVGQSAAQLGFAAAGLGLVYLSIWLMKRRVRRWPAAAIYERGIAVAKNGQVHMLPYGSFRVTRMTLVGLGTSFLGLQITGPGVNVELHADHVERCKALADHLESALGTA